MRRDTPLNVLKNIRLAQHEVKRAWKDIAPQKTYDAVIIGGGAQGLATAYALAKTHSMYKIAVLEANTLGSDHPSRNQICIAAQADSTENTPIYTQAFQAWQGLSQALKANVKFTQRGQIRIFHSSKTQLFATREANFLQMKGQTAQILDQAQLQQRVPQFVPLPSNRFPVCGALWQANAGIAAYDSLVWAYAQALDALGVDILEHCDIERFVTENGQITALETTRGRIETPCVGLSVAKNTKRLWELAGLQGLPVDAKHYAGFVTEAAKPLLHAAIKWHSPDSACTLLQSEQGNFHFTHDLTTHSSTNALERLQHQAKIATTHFPFLGRVKVERSWSDHWDSAKDDAAIQSITPIQGLYVNTGWSYEGLRAAPIAGASFARLLATQTPDESLRYHGLERFARGGEIYALNTTA